MIATALLLSLTAAAAGAQLSTADRAAIDAYRNALDTVSNGSTGGIEPAFSALLAAGRALMRVTPDDNTVLESLSKEEFLRVQRDLAGAVVNREEVLQRLHVVRQWKAGRDVSRVVGLPRGSSGRYRFTVDREIEAVSAALTRSTCACGDVASVATEMERFLQAVPQAPIRSAVSKRLEDVKSGHSEIQPRCTSG